MGIGSILLGVALFFLVALFVARPFLRPHEEEADLTEDQLLLEEKEALLDKIQALDFDHDTGKIPTELHAHQRAQLMARATAVLQALDAKHGVVAPPVVAEGDIDTDIEMEAAIARLRRQRRQAAPNNVAGPTRNGYPRFCPQCGQPTDADDRFCAHCGHNLTQITSTKTA